MNEAGGMSCIATYLESSPHRRTLGARYAGADLPPGAVPRISSKSVGAWVLGFRCWLGAPAVVGGWLRTSLAGLKQVIRVTY